ncbi:MAG: HlyD family efflux transporter periplasmic adaptor subunit [Candidatus Falkowbacteria bacterium]|nr:HlyD family efflux transporter periplasmic adaptor subunit [Candidatus Falkowbacteria bacterium]
MNKIIPFLKRFLRVKYLIWLLIIGTAVYFIYPKVFPKKVTPQYVLAAAEKGNLTVLISGTGQVSAISQVDVKPETSGKITAVKVALGQNIKAGDVIAIVDQRTALISLTQARASFASAQANYNKVLSGAASSDIKISQLSLNTAQSNYQQAQNDYEQTIKTANQTLSQAQDSLNRIADISSSYSSDSKRFQAISTIESEIVACRGALDLVNKILNDQDAKLALGALNSSYLSQTKNEYDMANQYVAPAVSSLDAAKSSRDNANISMAANSTLDLLNKTLAVVNSASYLLQNSVSSASFTQADLDSYKNSINSQINSINNGISSVQSSRQSLSDAVVNAQNSLTNAQLSLVSQTNSAQARVDSAKQSLDNAQAQYAKLTAPADKSTTQSAYSQLVSARANLESAQLNFDKTLVKSPIDGQVAALSATVGLDAGSSATVSGATALATIITKQQIAIIQLNEVDTAKIKVGQDADLTFDALPDLKIKGKVSEISGVGTVTSGVVNYSIKIAFDSQDARIKPGMSTSVDIIVSSRDGVLLVPSEAVKTGLQNNSYVETLPGVSANGRRPVSSTVKPVRQQVQVGESNDSQSEIISGLNEGDLVISRTIASSTTAAAAASGFSMFGGNRGGAPTGGATATRGASAGVPRN